MNSQLNLWNNFCDEYIKNKPAIPLFSTERDEINQKIVDTKEYGRINKRIILKRSKQMEALVIEEVTKVVNDFNQETNDYEGLIYMMYWLKDKQVIPLYIGKSEKYGINGKLSSNIDNIKRTEKSKFCRWGDGNYYHIGELSAVLFPPKPKEIKPGSKKEIKRGSKNKIKPESKYQKWAKLLFESYPIESYPTESPTLQEATYFWIHAWEKGTVGICKEFGSTSLTLQEYFLIGLASVLFPDHLLNHEGVNRKKGT